MISRTFTADDQLAFAELSGDFNPMHLDEVRARRMLFGRPVVHGIHALLWALDACVADRSTALDLRFVRAVFSKPIGVGESVDLNLSALEGGRTGVRLRVGAASVASIEVEWGSAACPPCDSIHPSCPDWREPRVLVDEDILMEAGTLDLHLHGETTQRMFPNLARCVAPVPIAMLLATTRLVGTICPGLHSIFSELVLQTDTSKRGSALRYAVTRFDRRVGLASMEIEGPSMVGMIKSFRRPPPVSQSAYLTMRDLVHAAEFAGQRALVIGGSRGLGEVAAKLLCGGGADVKITYHRGEQDAHRIVHDIVTHGGTADSFRFDVLNPRLDPGDVSAQGWAPTHLYYFATPFIFSGVRGVFSPALFRKFCDYYVSGFANTLDQLREVGTKRIFHPSTVAIEELPADMGEYAAAKAAADVLCAFIAKTSRDTVVFRPRFPRLATDQTVSIVPTANGDPGPILVETLRAFRDAAPGS